jgi:DNA gyrase/topoisomerase IV subunit B
MTLSYNVYPDLLPQCNCVLYNVHNIRSTLGTYVGETWSKNLHVMVEQVVCKFVNVLN